MDGTTHRNLSLPPHQSSPSRSACGATVPFLGNDGAIQTKVIRGACGSCHCVYLPLCITRPVIRRWCPQGCTMHNVQMAGHPPHLSIVVNIGYQPTLLFHICMRAPRSSIPPLLHMLRAWERTGVLSCASNPRQPVPVCVRAFSFVSVVRGFEREP